MDNAPLFKALVAFQRSVTNVAKDKTANTGKYGYTYADIAGVIEAVKEPLAANGLCYFQTLGHIDGKPALVTHLAHESGAIVADIVPLMGDLNDPQKFGGIVTYYRRYALLAILGLATEDDDANHARTPTPQDRGSTRQQVTDTTNRYQQDQSPVRTPQTQGGPSQGVTFDSKGRNDADEDMDWTQLYQLTRPLGYANQSQIENLINAKINGMTPGQVYALFKDAYGAIPKTNGAIAASPAQNGSRPQYPASEKQINFIRSLLTKKGMDDKAWVAWSMFALDTDQQVAIDNLDKQQASKVIEELQQMPDNPQMAAILEASGR